MGFSSFYPAMFLAVPSLLVLAWNDLAFRRLPNFWVGVYLLAFVITATLLPFSFERLYGHLWVGAAAFVVTSVFFALKWIGGGDVKLCTVVMLWAGPQFAVTAVLIIALTGGVLGLLCWLALGLGKIRSELATWPPLQLLAADRGVPYGVALCSGGATTLYLYYLESGPLFHL